MYVGVDVGASKTLLALFDESGKIIKQSKFTTYETADHFVKALSHRLKSLAGTRKLRAIGLGVPCSIDQRSKIIGCGNLPWNNFDLLGTLKTHWHCPIVIDNDAVLGGLAEARLGAGQDYEVVLYVTISTGVGTGIIVGGKILPALAKSEGGQMITRTNGSEMLRLEDLVSGPAVKERYRQLGYEITDPNKWDAIARDLAIGLFNMISFINPDVLVLGGGMAMHFDAFSVPLQKYLEELKSDFYPLPPIRQAKFVETAVVYGCYLIAKSAPRVTDQKRIVR